MSSRAEIRKLTSVTEPGRPLEYDKAGNFYWIGMSYGMAAVSAYFVRKRTAFPRKRQRYGMYGFIAALIAAGTYKVIYPSYRPVRILPSEARESS